MKKKMEKTHVIRWVIVAVVILLLLTTIVAAGKMNKSRARVKVFQVVPDEGTYEIRFDDSTKFKKITPLKDTRYKLAKAGEYNVILNEKTSEEMIYDEEIQLDPKKDYTIVNVMEFDEYIPLVFEDNNEKIEGRKSRIRFIHVTEEIFDVSVSIDNEVRWEELHYSDMGEYLLEDPGAHNITLFNSNGEEMISLQEIKLRRRMTHTLYLTGTEDEPKLTLVTDARRSLFQAIGHVIGVD